MARDGASGWDAYAPFYDWENARTFGRRDVACWKRFALAAAGRTLELGCGTGRLMLPLVRAGVRMTGVDRSATMLARARARARRLPLPVRPGIVRGDIRALPFPPCAFACVLAPYGMLQSLTDDADLDAALEEAARVLEAGGAFGIDLVPDLPAWSAYRNETRLRGRLGRASVTLVESVRQDRRRGLTIFDEEYVTREGRRTTRHTFSLTFRTIPMADLVSRVEAAGFDVAEIQGDYRGGPWQPDSEVWVVKARKRA